MIFEFEIEELATVPIISEYIYKLLNRKSVYSLKRILSGGAKIDTRCIQSFENLNIQVIEGYGATECSPVIATNTVSSRNYRSVGKILNNLTVDIDYSKEKDSKKREGEIVVKGETVYLG